MNFHKRLRKLQIRHELTFKAIATACEVSYQTVQQWAKDDGTYPKIENLEPLAAILKTTPWFLLFGIHAGNETPNSDPFPDLSDEAEDLIQCVIRLDKGGDLARRYFVLYSGLLLLQLAEERTEDTQAGLDTGGQSRSTAKMLSDAERIAHEELARVQPSGSKHAGPKRGDH